MAIAISETAKAIQSVFEELGLYVRFVAVSLEQIEGVEPVPPPTPESASATVKRALEDAEQLIGSAGAVSAVDRVHTALHGYLRSACQGAGHSLSGDESLAGLFRVLRRSHPAFQDPGPRGDDVARVGNGMATILDALGPLRNRASVAHANDELLEEPEAMLVINSARTLLHYFNAKARH